MKLETIIGIGLYTKRYSEKEEILKDVETYLGPYFKEGYARSAMEGMITGEISLKPHEQEAGTLYMFSASDKIKQSALKTSDKEWDSIQEQIQKVAKGKVDEIYLYSASATDVHPNYEIIQTSKKPVFKGK